MATLNPETGLWEGITDDQLLDMVVRDTAIGNVTLRVYLRELLLILWKYGVEFSSRRPFGADSWQYDVYFAMMDLNYIDGILDEDGNIDFIDDVTADRMILSAIKYLMDKELAGTIVGEVVDEKPGMLPW